MSIEPITQSMRKFVWVPLFVLGVLLAPTLNFAVGVAFDAYYRAFPISRVFGEVLRSDEREIYVHLRSEKRDSPECQFVKLRARTLDTDYEYELANMTRVDAVVVGETLPPGKHDLGIWRVEPRSDGVSVVIAQMYDCGGRVVWGGSVTMALESLKTPVESKT